MDPFCFRIKAHQSATRSQHLPNFVRSLITTNQLVETELDGKRLGLGFYWREHFCADNML
ncbi:hypothetical protein HanPSC8_Chr02g0057171 [Helianthus annuus]|nr:hypothetical protein HanPSC8_Chr02g0057171 [Helianthus annuus]